MQTTHISISVHGAEIKWNGILSNEEPISDLIDQLAQAAQTVAKEIDTYQDERDQAMYDRVQIAKQAKQSSQE